MKQFILSIRVYIILTLLIGVFYTGAVTLIAHFVFPAQAGGSLINKNNSIKGSALIGQSFTNSRYFYSRPSAISYNPLPSGASNLSVTSIQLKDSVEQRRKRFISINRLPETTSVPSDMLFSSGSGLDPHISPEAAFLQISRIGFERHFTSGQKAVLASLVEQSIEKPQLGFLGEPRINVLKLNLELDSLGSK
jgi:K+-transporting ATPase ATPase C chain